MMLNPIKSVAIRNALLLTVLLEAAVSLNPLDAQALSWGVDPVGLFKKPAAEQSATVSEKSVKKARKQAEKARAKADEATLQAEHARLEANARESALQKLQSQAIGKPVVSPTPAAVAQQKTLSRPETVGEEKNDKRNFLGWFEEGNNADTSAAGKQAPIPAVKLQPEKPQVASMERESAVTANRVVVLQTERGTIAFELYPEAAPITVANFVKLVEAGFYNQSNMKFHRVIPGFVAQTGDPTGTGAGGSKDRIPLEVKNKLSHDAAGVVAMARSLDPNSASSQFYITLAPQKTLDGKYAVFGRVIAGKDVLERIQKDDKLYGIKLVDADEVTRDDVDEKKGFLKGFRD